MYAILFHIHMLDKKHIEPSSATIPNEVYMNLMHPIHHRSPLTSDYNLRSNWLIRG
ncbi:hypothetical protein [Paenibacillus sp. Soil766]|uniref:hypothetical protein n=1 Tax=Paenibacillus sp. Soil766 TaxID=1736404 RepID=UPI000A72D4A2|nr:hypothetical protein [Paenibacillus sp. Soil766]